MNIIANWVNISGFTITNSGSTLIPFPDAGIGIRSDNNTIVGNKIMNNRWGIYSVSVSHNTISENTIMDNDGAGIDLKESVDTLVNGNIITNNTDSGIFMFQSSHNIVSDNFISNNDAYGINVRVSSNITIIGNTISYNTYGTILFLSVNDTIIDNKFFSNGIIIGSMLFDNWNTHIIEKNTIDGRPIGYYKNTNNIVVPCETAQVILANCTNMTINKLDLSNGEIGIQMAFSTYNNVSRNTITNNNGSGIDLIESSENVIEDNIITGNTKTGIYLGKSTHNIISRNIIKNNSGSGIDLWYSSDNRIVGNNIRDNGGDNYLNQRQGIYVRQSSNITIRKNTIAHNNYGVRLEVSINDTITDNTFFSNGISILGYSPICWNSHSFEDNTVNGRSLRYYKHTKDIVVPDDTSQVILVNCSNMTIHNLNLSNGETSIQLAYSSKNIISENTISNNKWHGIYGLDTFNNNIFKNTIANNTWRGIWLIGSSQHNSISDNIIINNKVHGILFSGYATHYNIISGNTLAHNGRCITILDSFHNHIVENNIKNNTGIGIYLDCSSNTNISRNSIKNNWYGIIISGYLELPATHNNIIENNIRNNTEDGISMGGECSYSNISRNIIADSGMEGIHLIGIPPAGSYPNNNIISENKVIDNNGFGIRLFMKCYENTIYHNYFINNSEGNAYDDDTSLTNTWDDGYPSGGNYWSDYPGKDGDGDGIGDVPYSIPGGENQDRYPLGFFDETPPKVAITSPEEGYLYFRFQQIRFFTTFIIGKIDIQVGASDNQAGIGHVEFYIDDELQYTDPSAPYRWKWEKRAFFKHTIKVVAFDRAGNNASDEITVWKFF